MAAVVPPVFHEYEVPPDAVSIAVAPEHVIPSLFPTPEVSATATDGVGSGLTFIVTEEEAVQPFALVTVTVKVVVDEGETVKEDTIPPLLHE
jgi:hypothetical protein